MERSRKKLPKAGGFFDTHDRGFATELAAHQVLFAGKPKFRTHSVFWKMQLQNG
jgi:hypothetical protein